MTFTFLLEGQVEQKTLTCASKDVAHKPVKHKQAHYIVACAQQILRNYA